MNINKIINFCIVVEEGSMAKAAEKLFCSQPALTKQIHSLEEELGCSLFLRRWKKMELNDNGRAFYRFGKSIQTEYSHLKKELKALSGFREKTVRLGATNYIGVYLMPQIINSFKQEHPEIIISFTMDFLPNITKLLEADEVDFAIVPESQQLLHDAEYISRVLCQDEMGLVMPPDHPLCKKEEIFPADLAGYPFLISQSKSATREYVMRQLSLAGAVPTETVDMYNTEAIKHAVMDGMGISILSLLSVQAEQHSHSLVAKKISGLPLYRNVYCVHKKRTVRSPEMKLFQDAVCQMIRSL